MTTPIAILHDLAAGQSTAAAMADRLKLPTLVITGIVKNLIRDSLVEIVPHDVLDIYRLTLDGREKITRQPHRKA